MKMGEYEPLEIRAYFRSHSHLPIGEVMDKAGIWKQVGLKVTFEFCDSSSAAEKALFDGSVDFVSGNHISPYLLVRRGKPIVSLTSPSNSVNDKLVTRFPVKDVSELRGKRIGDTTLVDSIFVTGNTDKFEQAGLHVLSLDRLPMINGPTLTSTLTTLRKKAGLAERLVKAQVMAIHFARTRRGETEDILEGLRRRVPEAKNVAYRSVAKLLPKPYPDHEAVANAYKLCCLKSPEAEEMSPMALWDLHYLRELDNSEFIDALYANN